MKNRILLVLSALLCAAFSVSATVRVDKLNPTTFEVRSDDGRVLTLDFYGPRIVRLFLDPQGGIVRDPVASPPAQILVAQPRRCPGALSLTADAAAYRLQSEQITITIDRTTGRMDFTDRAAGKVVTSFVATDDAPSGIAFTPKATTLTLSATADEQFYGGGVQNGRWTHRGTIIAIENTNNWVDGGVASPTPFYWSTAGYGVMFHTFRPGSYDLCATDAKLVTLSHDEAYLDAFVMIDGGPVAVLNDFYQLTGHPVLLPKFGFYEGHLNAYNRDYWTEVDGSPIDKRMYGPSGSVAFEDGKLYKESQTAVEGGIRESLNGELEGNYQFSGRAAIDRYITADMPLGWFLPNDGYGAGYGQTSTLEDNVENLRQFGEYARSKGVEIGLWTQSDLHPKEGIEPLLQRDIVREVRDAGVRVLKTDVAWVGAGYSFGLNGVADVGEIMPYYGNDARPFIISLDGWAGTQRYAGIWTGDQTGGEWEYIRFHVPTYIGSGLSGQPNICSDMDGIFGGRNVPVNVRDFQWKTFSPMQLNMDGWGSNPKYPQALGEPAASINRWYLKLKSTLMPYTYCIAREAVDGLPMIRPVNTETLSQSFNSSIFNYEFLYGPSILVAPIYQNTAADADGNDVRNYIYLPEGQWVDFFSGQAYEGGRVINGFQAPLWKLPVFVRRGAIIPMVHAHNNPNQIDHHTRAFYIYPQGTTEFTAYDDDGRTQAYLHGESATTRVASDLNAKGVLTLTVDPTKGSFAGMERSQSTEFVINLSQKPKRVTLFVNGKKVRLDEVQSLKAFTDNTSVFFYDAAPELNLWATPGTPLSNLSVKHSPRLYVCVPETDITTSAIKVVVEGCTVDTANPLLKTTDRKPSASTFKLDSWEDGCISPDAYALPLQWTAADGADYYEIEQGGMIFSEIRQPAFTLEGLTPDTNYEVRVRAVNAAGAGEWMREKLRTSPDPLRFAIRGITAMASIPDQRGQGIAHLFDFDEGTPWHTAWDKPNSTPFDIIVDLHSVNHLDKIQYVPRPDHGNGTIATGTIATSMNGQTWGEEIPFTWVTDGTPKELSFASTPLQPSARYLRIHVEKSVGGFGSGQQLYVFRTEGSAWYVPGDINNDLRLDENDLTSYMNYTGLRQGDGDFEGYVSGGDINQNGLIDAYDISHVAIELEDGVSSTPVPAVAGSISITADKLQLNTGDVVTLNVSGTGLQSVNALSFALPYDATQFEYLGTEPVGMKEMRNLTYDRLHTNGQKALYPTFVNCGQRPTLEGNTQLMTITFRAKKKIRFNLKPQDIILVDKRLRINL